MGPPPGLLDDAVDRFCPAVADAAGCEVGQDLLAPAAQSLAESLDLGDRAGVECVEELLGELAARGLAPGVVEADLLIDAPGDLNLAIGVTDRQVLVEPFASPVGGMLVAGEKGAADLVQPVVLEATPVQGCCWTRRRTSSSLAGELEDVEGVEHGDGVRQLVADRVVESDWGAVSSVSAGPFPRPAPRTGRATSTASGSPRGDARVSRLAREPVAGSGGGDGRAAVAVAGDAHGSSVEQCGAFVLGPPAA